MRAFLYLFLYWNWKLKAFSSYTQFFLNALYTRIYNVGIGLSSGVVLKNLGILIQFSIRRNFLFISRGGLRSLDHFCFICGKFIANKQRQSITNRKKNLSLTWRSRQKMINEWCVCSICWVIQTGRKEKERTFFRYSHEGEGSKDRNDDSYFCSAE